MTKRDIRSLREWRALTQEELAERAGVAPGTVYRMEKGERVSARTRRCIAQALGIPVEELAFSHDQREHSETEAVL